MDITTVDLAPILAGAVGVREIPHDEAGFEDVLLLELGLDSLAVLEVLSAIKQRWGVSMPDDAVDGTTTVSMLLELTNVALRAANAKAAS